MRILSAGVLHVLRVAAVKTLVIMCGCPPPASSILGYAVADGAAPLAVGMTVRGWEGSKSTS